MSDPRVPVTVLTGFLGAGKTTLLRRILDEPHGLRIAVIENEVGEVSVDHALVERTDEQIVELNNGCLCCTVRGDLLRILGRLAERRADFDRVVIETTGLADPGPVVQTFLLDPEIADTYRLDGVVTVADARHLAARLADSDEARAQIAFADLVLVNKGDLVDAAALDAIEAEIRAINPIARRLRTVRSDAPIAQVLDLGGFDVTRALAHAPDLLEEEHAFAWVGEMVAAGPVVVAVDDHDHDHHDHHDHDHDHDHGGPRALLVAAPDRATAFAEADRRFDAEAVPLPTKLTGPGWLFLDDPCGATVDGAAIPGERTKRRHTHADGVGAVGFVWEGDVDADKFEAWFRGLLAVREPDLFRTKGVLAIAGHPRKVVIQAVHGTVDTDVSAPWGAQRRANTLVFIGRGLDRGELWAGLRSTLA